MAAARGRRAASLREWLRLYADHSVGQGARVSKAVRRVLQSALPSLFAEASRVAQSDWEVAVGTLEAFYEAPLGVDAAALPAALFNDEECTDAPLVRLLELALSAVVQSEEKAAFVRDIMAMDASVQVDLMATIEKVMAHGVGSPAASDNQASEEAEDRDARDAASMSTPVAKARSPSRQQVETGGAVAFQSPLHLSSNAEFERVKRENAVLRDENGHMSEELTTARQKLKRRDAEKEALASQIQELRQERERDLLRKEHSVRALLEDRLQQMQRDLEAATAELQAKATIASAVPALRDEIDLLRPAAQRVDKMGGKLAKYKSKIEQLAGLNGKLRAVERANEELMSKNLELESRIAKSANLQRRLDEAKDANTGLEFRVSELEALLSRQSHELEVLKSDSEASEVALQETRALNQQLQATVALQASGGGASQNESLGDAAFHAVAGGVSELNPELMQKLQRLEFENSELKLQVDGETSERIDSLLEQIADLTRLKKSFEGRYFDAAQQLEGTREQLDESRRREGDVRALLATTQKDLHEMTRLRNESASELATAMASIAALRDAEARMESELRQRRQAEAALQTQLSGRDQTIKALNATAEQLGQVVEMLRKREALVLEDVASHAMERRVAFAERQSLKREIQRLQSTLIDCQADFTDLLQRLRTAQEECEARGMAQEELLARLLVEHQRVIEQRTDHVASKRKHEALVSDLGGELAISKERLREYRERISMQLEDSRTALERLRQSMVDERSALSKRFAMERADAEDREAHLVRTHRATVQALERKLSDTIARMTGAIDAKAMALEVAVKSLNEYKQMHSVSNDEWARQEQALEGELRQARLQLEAHEARNTELTATLGAHEEEQLRLKETNRALEAEVAELKAAVTGLETAVALLTSKTELLEKERDNRARREERQRSLESVSATFSAQQNNQIDSVTAELEKLAREHQQLKAELQACRCNRSAAVGHNTSAVLLSPEEKKDYYRARIRHLEQDTQQQDDKRRELLLVNAKLVQEQKQLRMRNEALALQVQTLNEVISLKERDSVKPSESSQRMDARRLSSRVKLAADSELLTSDQALGPAVERLHDQPGEENARPIDQSNATPSKSQTGRKRALEDTKPAVAFAPEPPRVRNHISAAITAASMREDRVEKSGAIRIRSDERNPGVQRSKQRRLAHFFANNAPSSVPVAPKDEKPSECNQQ